MAMDAVVRLQEWWQGSFSTSWQAIAAVIQPQQWVTAWRSEATDQPVEFAVSRVKVLEFGSQPGDAAIALVMGISAMTESRTMVRLIAVREPVVTWRSPVWGTAPTFSVPTMLLLTKTEVPWVVCAGVFLF